MSRRRVLVFDEDAEATSRLVILLTLLGHDAVGTMRVAEGAEALNLAPYDLLLARHGLPGRDLAVIADAKRPSVEIAFIADHRAPSDCASPRHPVLTEPYTREQLERVLALAFALHETKVAASTYIETVRDACSAPGERKSALALQGTRDQVEALKAIVETKPVTGR